MNKIKISYRIIKFSIIALFILMQIYLIFINRHYALDLDITPNNQPSVNIYQEEKIGQTFISKRNGLAKIDIMLGTHGRKNNQDVIFILREKKPERKVVRRITFNASTVVNNLYYPLEFKPLRMSKGKEYTFILESPESSFENSICAWTNTKNIYRQGAYIHNSLAVGGDIIFRAYSKRPIFTELKRIVRNYEGIFGKVWLLILAIIFFEFVQIVFLSKLLDFFHKNMLNGRTQE